MDTPGRVSLRSSRPQVMSLGALKTWKIWGVGVRSTLLQADGPGRDGYLRAPLRWNPWTPRRIWKLREPEYGLNDVTVAFRLPLRKYLVNSAESPNTVGLKCRVSSFDPRGYFVSRIDGGAVGAITTHS